MFFLFIFFFLEFFGILCIGYGLCDDAAFVSNEYKKKSIIPYIKFAISALPIGTFIILLYIYTLFFIILRINKFNTNDTFFNGFYSIMPDFIQGIYMKTVIKKNKLEISVKIIYFLEKSRKNTQNIIIDHIVESGCSDQLRVYNFLLLKSDELKYKYLINIKKAGSYIHESEKDWLINYKTELRDKKIKNLLK